MFEPKIFDYDTSTLELWQQRVIEKLKEVGNICHEIWLKQIDPKSSKAVFYDMSLSKNDVIEAGKADPEILSPYTLVKVLDGEITAVPYREEYSHEIEKIVERLYEASSLSEDSDLSKYLNRLAKAFDTGDFDEALVAYLEDGNSKIDVLMGPIETYVDKLLGTKKAFQFNLRVMCDEETDQSLQYINVIKQADVLKPVKSAANSVTTDKIKIRVDDVLMFTGRQAGTHSMATNLPNESENVAKYGTKVVLYNNSMKEKYLNLLKPFLKYIKSPSIESKTDKEIQEALVRQTALHEITEAIVKFEDAHKRLDEYHDVVMELNSELLGAKSAQYHVLKGMITDVEYENILLSIILDGLDKCKRSHDDPSLESYAKGYRTLFNYSKSTGGIKIVDKKMTIDFKQFAQDVGNLANINLEVFQEGDYQTAYEVFNKYGEAKICDDLGLLDSES